MPDTRDTVTSALLLLLLLLLLSGAPDLTVADKDLLFTACEADKRGFLGGGPLEAVAGCRCVMSLDVAPVLEGGLNPLLAFREVLKV